MDMKARLGSALAEFRMSFCIARCVAVTATAGLGVSPFESRPRSCVGEVSLLRTAV